MGAVYKRELKAYLHNVYGFLFAAVLLLVFGFIIFMSNPNPNYYLSDLTYAFQYGELALILLVPVLCMRVMSEDRRNKTDMFYLTLPMRTSSVILGKYFALLTVYAIPTHIKCLYPLILNCFGTVNLPYAYVSILLFFLLGAALMAVCMFVSSLTGHLVVSAVLGILSVGVLYFMPWLASMLPFTSLASYIGLMVIILLLALAVYAFTKSLTVTLVSACACVTPLSVAYVVADVLVKQGKIEASFMEGLLQEILCNISPFFLFENALLRQTFDIFGVIMMLSVSVFFVYLTIQSADRRRWA